MPDTVTVASKLQNGLVLQLYKMVPTREPLPGGGTRETKRAEKVHQPITIAGCAVFRGVDLAEREPKVLTGGYALTHGVDAEFFAEWLRQNADADIVRNKLVFAHATDTAGQAKEHAALKSGAEPLEVPRHRGEKVTDQRIVKSAGSIQTADVK
jgi:hypothetical protein